MSENFDDIQNGLLNANCLLTDNKLCNEDGKTFNKDDISSYCNKGMNMLTEDICYDWYANSVYPTSPKERYYDSSAASLAFENACSQYPWHPQCKCRTAINKFYADSFTLTSDPSKVYNVSCLFPACSRSNLSYKSMGRPYVPHDIVHDNTIVCPSTICTNNITNSTINMKDSVFKLENICGIENDINTENDRDIENPETKDDNVTSFFQKNKTLIIVCCVVFVFLLLIIVIVKSKSGNNDDDKYVKMMLLKKMMNKRK